MPERRHRAALDHAHAAVLRSPLRHRSQRNSGRQPSRRADRREPSLEGIRAGRFGAEVIHQNDFAARLEHADEFVERGFGIRHGGDDILRDDDIEDAVLEAEMLGIHHRKPVDIAQPMLGHARLALRSIGAERSTPMRRLVQRIIGQRQAGPDADFENAAADPFGRRDRCFAAALEHRAEYEIVDRRPAGIGPGDRVLVEFVAIAPCRRGRAPARRRFSAPRPGRPEAPALPSTPRIVLAMMPPPSTRA